MGNKYIPIILILAVVSSVIAIDIYIPCLPNMVEYFSSSQELVQLSISSSILGSSLWTPFIGPLSDALGRRHLMVWSQALYALACFLCALSPNAESLIILRFFQGIAGTAAFVLVFSIITDLYEGRDVGVYFAMITTAITSSLMVAPLIGGYIAEYYIWQDCFSFLGILALISFLTLYFGLPETINKMTSFSMKDSMKLYRKIILNSSFMGMAVIPSIMIGGMVAFLACASFYYIDNLGVSSGMFSIYQACVMGSNTLFSYLAGRMIYRHGARLTMIIGMGIFTMGGLSFMLVSLLFPYSSILITTAISLYASGIGFVFAAITAESMALYPDNTGATSSMLSLVRGLLISACVSFASYLYTGELLDIALLLLMIIVGCLIIFIPLTRRLPA